MRYRDFELHIERFEEQYKAHVLSSPAGQASSVFSVPFSPDKLDSLVTKLGHVRRGTRSGRASQIEAAKELGGNLFDAVFGSELLACYRSSLHAVRSQEGCGLRIKLRLQNVAELADLPWEFLLDKSLNRFLAQSNQTPVVRYIEMPETVQPLATPPPLRILVMISSPKDDPDYKELNVEQETASLHQALAPLIADGKVSLTFLKAPTLAELKSALKKERYHVFHFMGHGEFVAMGNRGEGTLVLEDKQGRARREDAGRIGAFLHDHTSLRLAVLNACEGARNSKEDVYAGVASKLIQQGIPAVVAMQFEITDEAAIIFAEEFYTALAEGFPVDAAVAEARKGILAQPNDVEWGTPVLYMRSADGVLFDLTQVTSKVALAPPQVAPPPAPAVAAPSPPPKNPSHKLPTKIRVRVPAKLVQTTAPAQRPPKSDRPSVNLPGVRTMAGHGASVNCLAFSPDGRTLASGAGDEYWSADNDIRLWRVSDGELLRTLKGHTQRIMYLDISPDGRLLASGSGGGFWGSDNTARLWDVDQGKLLNTLEGHANYVGCVVFSRDGATLASASLDNTVRLWKIPSGLLLHTLRHDNQVGELHFSPDGATLAAPSLDQTVRLWNVADGKLLRKLEGHTGPVNKAVFSPSGALIASSSSDHTIRLWQPSSGRLVHTLGGHMQAVVTIAFSPDGELLASGSMDQTVRIWRVSKGKLWRTFQSACAARFTRDGTVLITASADHTLRLWQVSSGKLINKLAGHTAPITAIMLSPDGQILASASQDKTVRLWGLHGLP